jgi:hypothetical protein
VFEGTDNTTIGQANFPGRNIRVGDGLCCRRANSMYRIQFGEMESFEDVKDEALLDKRNGTALTIACDLYA